MTIEKNTKKAKLAPNCTGIGYLLRNAVEDASELIGILNRERDNQQRLVYLAEQIKSASWIAAMASLAEELEDIFALAERGTASIWNALDSVPLEDWDASMRQEVITVFARLITDARPLFQNPESCFAELPVLRAC